MVLTATMMMLILVAIALGITAASRRATSRYTYNTGLYDLAVSGNEQALFLLNQTYTTHREVIYARAFTRAISEINPMIFELSCHCLRLDQFANSGFMLIFIQEAMLVLREAMSGSFTPIGGEYRLSWNLESTIQLEDRVITDIFRAVTTLTPENNRFPVTTSIRKYNNYIPTVPTVVSASIIWSASGYREILLDAHTISILTELGADYPIPLVPGTIIILDEFTLEMVESLRIAD